MAVGIYMAGDSGRLLHMQKRLCVGAAYHKQICIRPLYGISIHQSRWLAGPVYLHGLTELVLQMHGGLGYVQIVSVILIELGWICRGALHSDGILPTADSERHRSFAFPCSPTRSPAFCTAAPVMWKDTAYGLLLLGCSWSHFAARCNAAITVPHAQMQLSAMRVLLIPRLCSRRIFL